MYIHVLSPYRRQFAYPAFWRLLDRLSESHEIFSPIECEYSKLMLRVYNTKLKHLLPLLSCICKSIRSGRQPDVIITFGTYQIILVFFLRVLFPKARLITYQPELFEFNSSVLTLMFRMSAHLYDLFVDVEEMRLKLRRRYFRKMRYSHKVVLPNFAHKVQAGVFDLKTRKVVYAGVVDSEDVLINMCDHFGIDENSIDCYVSGYHSKSIPKVFIFLPPRPFDEIAEKKYGFGLICYPFFNGDRKSLNNKYCAPSKLFTYLSFGIFPVHYSHPTLSYFVKSGMSTDSRVASDTIFNVNESRIRALFQLFETKIANATEIIENALEHSAREI